MQDTNFPRRRIAGVTVPLFSVRTENNWGIGEIGDLPELASFLSEAGFALVQLLPLGELPANESSPYGALSAFGIDPIYISIHEVPDINPSELRRILGGDEGYRLLGRAKGASEVDYGAVRTLKMRALKSAFDRFVSRDFRKHGLRAEAFNAFVREHAEWVRDYALFRVIKEAYEGKPWWEWPAPLARRDKAALEQARSQYGREIFFYEYVQFIAHAQWADACAKAQARGVEVMGDLPFMVGRDSADVWANQGEFRLDMSVGAPPDQFNEEGQDWGLPPYAWSVMTRNDFAWLKKRARYSGLLYERFRIDHLVGFFRTYMRPWDSRVDEKGKLIAGTFDPSAEPIQKAHGEHVIAAMKDAALEKGSLLVAEDLGTIPDYVRPALARLGVPGYKVLIWERDYEKPGHPFIDPTTYPIVSVACYSTHDTEPVALWWEGLSDEDRAAVKAIPSLLPHAAVMSETFTQKVHAHLLDLIFGASSELALLLMQDVLGTRERINTPSTVGSHNWTYRLPATLNELRRDREIQSILSMIRSSLKAHRRLG